MKLYKSKYLYSVKTDKDSEIYYHALFGNAREIDCNTKMILDFFEDGDSVDNLVKVMNINNDEYEIVSEIIQDFLEAKYLLKSKEDERIILIEDNNKFMEISTNSFPFDFIGFSVTNRCNFACKYCIAGANVLKESYIDFDKEKLKSYLIEFADILIDSKKNKINIGFTGGEPLLYWEELKNIIEEFYEKYASKLEIEIAINTNVSLVTNEIARFFEKYKITPSTSLDGIDIWNNKVRVYKNGKNTFQDIMEGIHILRKNNVVCESFYLTLTKENFEFNIIQLIEFAKQNGFKSITIEPDLINIVDIDTEQLCEKIFKCYKMGIENGIEISGFWKRPYDNMVDYKKSSNGFCGALSLKSIVIDKDGFIEPCGYSSLKIEKISELKKLATNDKYKNFIMKNLRGNIEKCKGCRIEGVCKGGCLISREIDKQTDDIFQYRCSIYLKMTELLLKEGTYERTK